MQPKWTRAGMRVQVEAMIAAEWPGATWEEIDEDRPSPNTVSNGKCWWRVTLPDGETFRVDFY